MNSKHIALITLLLVLLVVPTLAQDEVSWSVHLYDPVHSQMMIYHSDADNETIDLELPEYAVDAHDLAFTADGARMAYCRIAKGVKPESYTLVVYDTRDQVNIVERELGTGMACRTGDTAFSEDGSKIAVGFIDNFVANPNPDHIPWHVYILDADTGDTLHELNHDSDLVAALTFDAVLGISMPYFRNFGGDTISFALIPWFSDAAGPYNAVTWDFAANTLVNATEFWGRGNFDVLETAEGWALVYPDFDPTLPAATARGPIPSYNVVKVLNPDGTTTVIYTDENEVIDKTVFINDGNAVAVHLWEGFDGKEDGSQSTHRWIAVDRDGSVTDLTQPMVGPSDLRAIPGGYVVLEGKIDSETNPPDYTFTVHNDVSGTNSEVMAEGSWGFAWTTPVDAVSFTPFAAAQ